MSKSPERSNIHQLTNMKEYDIEAIEEHSLSDLNYMDHSENKLQASPSPSTVPPHIFSLSNH